MANWPYALSVPELDQSPTFCHELVPGANFGAKPGRDGQNVFLDLEAAPTFLVVSLETFTMTLKTQTSIILWSLSFPEVFMGYMNKTPPFLPDSYIILLPYLSARI